MAEYLVRESKPRLWTEPVWRVHFITVEGSVVICECSNKHDAERI